MALMGLYIVLNGKKRFVGKVGRCPNVSPDYLAGRVIYYKSEPFSKVYSYTLKAISTDRAAWNKGRELGAEFLVIHCPDEDLLLVTAAEDIEKISFDYSLGEGVQIRIPDDDVRRYQSRGIQMGYTKPENDIVLVPREAATGKPKATSDDQGSLF